ncbi:unnamed protein product [Tilletia controversa]|nr:unnamed protein product [Tilletia controversa]CAD7067172.1 unnamed protein product [Tilletia caries]
MNRQNSEAPPAGLPIASDPAALIGHLMLAMLQQQGGQGATPAAGSAPGPPPLPAANPLLAQLNAIWESAQREHERGSGLHCELSFDLRWMDASAGSTDSAPEKFSTPAQKKLSSADSTVPKYK